MGRGDIVQISHRPDWQSVQNYKDHLKFNSPNLFDWTKLWEPDIECTCCTQEAPAEAAALLKVEDETPFSQKFGLNDVSSAGTQGETMWICADCFHNGVRPKHVYFGDIRWNKYGRTVKQRAEESNGHPW